MFSFEAMVLSPLCKCKRHGLRMLTSGNYLPGYQSLPLIDKILGTEIPIAPGKNGTLQAHATVDHVDIIATLSARRICFNAVQPGPTFPDRYPWRSVSPSPSFSRTSWPE